MITNFPSEIQMANHLEWEDVGVVVTQGLASTSFKLRKVPSAFVVVRFARIFLPKRSSVGQCIRLTIYYSGFYQVS